MSLPFPYFLQPTIVHRSGVKWGDNSLFSTILRSNFSRRLHWRWHHHTSRKFLVPRLDKRVGSVSRALLWLQKQTKISEFSKEKLTLRRSALLSAPSGRSSASASISMSVSEISFQRRSALSVIEGLYSTHFGVQLGILIPRPIQMQAVSRTKSERIIQLYTDFEFLL